MCFRWSNPGNSSPGIVGDIGRKIPPRVALVVGLAVEGDGRRQEASKGAWKAVKVVGTGGGWWGGCESFQGKKFEAKPQRRETGTVKMVVGGKGVDIIGKKFFFEQLVTMKMKYKKSEAFIMWLIWQKGGI